MNKAIKNILRKNKYIEMFSYMLQNNQLFNSSGSGEFGDDVVEVYGHNANISRMYAENYSGNLEGKVVLEIGTGFTRATMLNMIKECNLKKVYCYDRFDCINEIDLKIINEFCLEDYIDRLVYISGENKLLTNKIQSNSVDYIVSNAVLEHVDDLFLLLGILDGVLKHGGQMYHKVDLRCHNRFKGHGELYFHTFSKKMWDIMGGNIGQPNRLLLEDYCEMFENLHLNYEVNIVEKFSKGDLLKAKVYLKEDDVFKYDASVVEFIISKT